MKDILRTNNQKKEIVDLSKPSGQKVSRRHGLAMILAASGAFVASGCIAVSGTNNDGTLVDYPVPNAPEVTIPSPNSAPAVRTETVVITNEQKKLIFDHAEAVVLSLNATFKPEIIKSVRKDSRLDEIMRMVSAVQGNKGDVRAVDGRSVLYEGYWQQGKHPNKYGYIYTIDPTEFDLKDPELAGIYNRHEDQGFSIDLITDYMNKENFADLGLPQRWYMQLTPHNRSIDLSPGGAFQVRRVADKMLILRGPNGEIGNWAMTPKLVPDITREQTSNGYHRMHIQHDIHTDGKRNPKTGEASNYRSLVAQATDFGQLTVDYIR